MLAVLVVGLILRVFALTHNPTYVYDENYYAPAGCTLVGVCPHPGMGPFAGEAMLAKSPDPNVSHPVLGKLLIGTGIVVLGDRALGWRVMPVFAGLLSLWAFHRLARRMLDSEEDALIATALLAVDGMHVSVSRMAILDMFLFLFTTAAMLATSHVLATGGRDRKWIVAVGACLGLAMLVKTIACLTALAFVAIVFLLPGVERKARLGTVSVAAGVASLVFLSWAGFFLAKGCPLDQWLYVLGKGIRTGALPRNPSVLRSHRYSSQPYAWLFDARGMWFRPPAPDGTSSSLSSLLGLGNPVTWLSFLPASYKVYADWRERQDPRDAFLLIWFVVTFVPMFAIS